MIDLKKEATEQNEFYELDIESLNHDRLFEIQKYVNSCNKSAGDSIPTRYLDEKELANLRKMNLHELNSDFQNEFEVLKKKSIWIIRG